MMCIDNKTMFTAFEVFESRYGSLGFLLNELSRNEKRKLLRYGKISKKMLTNYDAETIQEFRNIHYEIKQILINELVKPRIIRTKKR